MYLIITRFESGRCISSFVIIIYIYYYYTKFISEILGYYLSHFVSDTRETGFVNAIIAAGITFQVTRACTKGELIGCSCQKRKKPKKMKKKILNSNQMSETDFKWAGCGENIEFGMKKSKDFLDIIYKKRSDMKTLVKLHNYVAGRLVSNFAIMILIP